MAATGYSAKRAADEIGVSVRTVWRMTERGDLTAQKEDGITTFDPAEVTRVARERAAPHEADEYDEPDAIPRTQSGEVDVATTLATALRNSQAHCEQLVRLVTGPSAKLQESALAMMQTMQQRLATVEASRDEFIREREAFNVAQREQALDEELARGREARIDRLADQLKAMAPAILKALRPKGEAGAETVNERLHALNSLVADLPPDTLRLLATSLTEEQQQLLDKVLGV